MWTADNRPRYNRTNCVMSIAPRCGMGARSFEPLMARGQVRRPLDMRVAIRG